MGQLNIEEKIVDFCEYIKLKLTPYKGEDFGKTKIGFGESDYKETGYNREIFYCFLRKLEDRGVIKNISIVDEDGFIEKGKEKYYYCEYPEYYPGDYEVIFYPNIFTYKIPSEKVVGKTNIIISHDKGIYRLENRREFIYPIQEGSNRDIIIRALLEKKKTAKELCDIVGYSNSTLSKEIREINRNFCKKLQLPGQKLIIHQDTGGYTINKSEFRFDLGQNS